MDEEYALFEGIPMNFPDEIKHPFEVIPMTFPDDSHDMEELVFNRILADMSLTRTFNINTRLYPPSRFPSPHEPSGSCAENYFKVVNKKGDIIGMATIKNTLSFQNNEETTNEWVNMTDFLTWVEKEIERLAKRGDLPKNLLNIEKIVDLFVWVDPAWRKRGFARALIEKCMESARAEGYTLMKVRCGDEYLAGLMRRLGWNEIYRIAYREYPYKRGIYLVLRPQIPHQRFYHFTIEL